MAFQVIWAPKAESQLMKLWLASRSRQRIREASDELERLLKCQALEMGESRDENLRIVFLDVIGR